MSQLSYVIFAYNSKVFTFGNLTFLCEFSAFFGDIICLLVMIELQKYPELLTLCKQQYHWKAC